MTIVNNVYAIRVNTVSNNGSINFGTTSHRGHQVKVDFRAGYVHAGDVDSSYIRVNHVNERDGTENVPEKNKTDSKKEKNKSKG